MSYHTRVRSLKASEKMNSGYPLDGVAQDDKPFEHLDYLKQHFAKEKAAERMKCAGNYNAPEKITITPDTQVNVYDKHAASNKAQLEKSVFPTTIKFTLCGTPTELENMDPIQNNVWKEPYNRCERDAMVASPWKSMYDPEGPMARYMQPSSTDVTSGVVALGGQLLSATNTGPFTVGVFAIGAKVTRSPSNQVYEKRVQEIIKQYKQAMASKVDYSQEISLIDILEPETTQCLDNCCFFLDKDLVSTNHSQSQPENNSKYLKWVHCKEKDVMDSILSEKRVPCQGGHLDYVLLYAKSLLLNYIKSNAVKCMKAAGETNPAICNFSVWKDELKWALSPKDIEERQLSPTDCQQLVLYTPVLKRLVDAGKKLLLEEIKKSPLENLNNQQFYVARLDAKNWTDRSEEVPDVDGFLNERLRVSVSVQYIYEVSTNANS